MNKRFFNKKQPQNSQMNKKFSLSVFLCYKNLNKHLGSNHYFLKKNYSQLTKFKSFYFHYITSIQGGYQWCNFWDTFM